MKTPIFGPDETSRSTRFSFNQLWNVYPEISEIKDGVSVGVLYNTPGLDLISTVGSGPIRIGGLNVTGNLIYAVSDLNVYSINQSWAVSLVGVLPNPITTPVQMITNGTQTAIFDGVGGYLVPGGYPLTGGNISAPGSLYSVGDVINLIATDGTTNATAQIIVKTLSGSGVATFGIQTVNGNLVSGAFGVRPTQFTQASTTGSGSGFILNLPTYGAFQGVYTIPLPFTGNPGSATYQDGFGLVAVQNTQDFYQSNLFDLSIWQALNFDTADATPDNITGLFSIHREIWVLKQNEVEVWINAGLPGFAFQRLEGVFPHVGLFAPESIAKVGESLMWLAQSTSGTEVFVRSNGYSIVQVSTSAIAFEIQSYAITSDAFAYSYQQSGHTFYVCTFPSAGFTWVYDMTTSDQVGFPCWHRRAAFSNGQFTRHWGNAFVNFNQLQLVGDYRNGNIYALDLNTFTDNGQQRKWLRSWRALERDIPQPMTISNLQIDMQTGLQVPPGANPQLVLRYSNDSGNTWSNSLIGSAGKTGNTTIRVKFNRLGSTRRNAGLTRVFELSSTDPFPVAITDAEVNV